MRTSDAANPVFREQVESLAHAIRGFCVTSSAT